MKSMLASCVAMAACVGTASARRAVREYEINLDLPPKERFLPMISDTANGFNKTVWDFYNNIFASDKVLTDALYLVSAMRGPENDELTEEVQSLADASGLPFKFVKSMQMLYELQTLMVPIENITIPNVIPAGFEDLARIPWRGPGCTGIIAQGGDGTVYHARNLDFSPLQYMTDLVYTGIFTKGGKEIFRSQMVAGYQCLVTGMRFGENGYTIERNTRYPEGLGGNEAMLDNLLKEKRPLNGWSLRKIMEGTDNYDDAVSAVSSTPYVSTEYAIMSGVKKGTILSKDPDSVAHKQILGQPNFEERDDYIIITNFDFFFHDLREWFDPTGGKIGRPRRVVAQQVLNASSPITGDLLFEAINAEGVIADTIFQGLFNVELGMWNATQPDL